MDGEVKKRRKSSENNKPGEEIRVATSKFFSGPENFTPGWSGVRKLIRHHARDSQAGRSRRDDRPDIDGDEPEAQEVVQEDGYFLRRVSSYRFETPEVSTPHRRSRMSKSGVGQEDDDDFDAELLSSPVEGRRHRGKASKRAHEADLDRKELGWTINGDDIDSGDDGPDLRGSFEDVEELPSDIDCLGPESSLASTATTSSRGPITPNHTTGLDGVAESLEEIEEDGRRGTKAGSISDGWMKRWSYNGLEIKKVSDTRPGEGRRGNPSC